jgi:hypothetical protein
MRCTHIDHSAATATECGNEDFDLATSAMASVDLSGEPGDHTISFDGLSYEDVELVCKKCRRTVPLDTELTKTVTVLLLRLEKQLGASLPPMSAYVFEDGSEIRPEATG